MKQIQINLAWLALVFLFAFASYFSGRKYLKEREKRIRIEQSFSAANRQIEYYKAKNGDLVALNDAIQLQFSELKEIYPKVVAELNNLKLNPKLTENYSQSVIHEFKEIKTILKDSLIFDTIPTRVFNYHDPYYDISGIAVRDTQKVRIESRDTLVQVVFRGKRINPWLWIFSKRKLQLVISNKNPNNKVVFSNFIKIIK